VISMKRFMHRAVSLPALLLSLFIIGCSGDAGYPLVGGGSHSFKNSEGKTTLINYWAEWCKPCRIEVPELNKLAEEHADQVTVLSVNYDNEQGETLLQQLNKIGIQFQTLAVDPRSEWGLERAQVLPETLVINSKGELVQRLIGPQTLESLKAALME